MLEPGNGGIVGGVGGGVGGVTVPPGCKSKYSCISRVQVMGPTMPSIFKPNIRWKVKTAFWVFWPKMPSASICHKPGITVDSRLMAICTCLTAAPLEPIRKFVPGNGGIPGGSAGGGTGVGGGVLFFMPQYTS